MLYITILFTTIGYYFWLAKFNQRKNIEPLVANDNYNVAIKYPKTIQDQKLTIEKHDSTELAKKGVIEEIKIAIENTYQ